MVDAQNNQVIGTAIPKFGRYLKSHKFYLLTIKNKFKPQLPTYTTERNNLHSD
jgi:hypothetical protein